MKEDEGSAAISPSSGVSVSKGSIFLRILSIIFVAEFLVMILIWRIDVTTGVFEFLLDSFFLAVLSAPFLYYLVVRVVARRLTEHEAVARQALEEALTAKAYAEKMALKAYADNIVRSVPSGLVALSRDLDVMRVNPSICRMFSVDENDLVGRPVHEALPFHGLTGPIEEVLSTGRSVNVLVLESSVSGQKRYYQASVNKMPFMEGEGEQSILLTFEDITDRKRSEDQVDFMAHHDNLTGLPNRRLLKDRINQMLPRLKRARTKAAVLFLDLDRFKFINDTLGHSVGDELLKIVAKRLAMSIRPSDTAARLGGDEFIVLLSDIASVDDVTKVIMRIHSSFDAPVNLKGHELTVTASIGASVYPADGADAEDLIKNADTAMYRAKSEGRNNSQFYTPAMNESGMEWIRLERKLHVAIEKEEFVLHYQPQIDISTGKVIGVESLVRWQEPETGLIPPGGFIKMAEDTGLIVQIGEWVLRRSCMDCKRWHDMGLNMVRVSVNLSMRQFKQEGFVTTVAGVLEETALPPEKLELELTESIIMEDAEETIKKLQELKNMGVRLAIDDFGTGYSSLAYLKRMPLDVLKIDQSFVRDINVDEGDRVICAAVIRLAGSLDIMVVAEGVETYEQLGLLKELECGYIQGYIVTKPVPARDVEVFLAPGWLFKPEAGQPEGNISG